MESIPITINKRRTKNIKPKDDNNLGNIIEEYCLKRNQFNPRKSSPDMFNKKLQHRMQLYYNTLYTLSSSPSKY
jgi:hypothetical protein